jgi:predicted PurR-regulated permease PerM
MLKPWPITRINSVMLFFILLIVILHFGREFFVLITFSGFLAMLMTPVSNKLEKTGIPRVYSTLLSVMVIVIVITAFLLLISAQIAVFSEDLPKIQSKFEELVSNIQAWIENQLGISYQQQASTIKEQSKNALGNVGGFLTSIIKGTTALIGSVILVLVFLFLFLLHREKYENFVLLLYKDEKRDEAKIVINKISKIAQHYLTGRAISMTLLAILYAIGLLIIGLKNAILLSLVAAAITFVPYVGPFIGGLVPFFMAIVTGNSFTLAIEVVIVIVVTQTFQNYFIEPYVVGGSVNISPFFTILILILGGIIWGVAGIVLFLPLLGVIKIIFENAEGLQPYAYLIGDQKESSAPSKIWDKAKKVFKHKH